MSLLLCRQEPVTAPYYVEALGVHLYFFPGALLCDLPIIPLLVMEDFVDERLTAFLRSELRMPFWRRRIEKWLESRGESDELLFAESSQDCSYLNAKEQADFRQTVTAFRKPSQGRV